MFSFSQAVAPEHSLAIAFHHLMAPCARPSPGNIQHWRSCLTVLVTAIIIVIIIITTVIIVIIIIIIIIIIIHHQTRTAVNVQTKGPWPEMLLEIPVMAGSRWQQQVILLSPCTKSICYAKHSEA